jgi:hypothetical protein
MDGRADTLVFPAWNWAGRKGRTIPVMASTNAEQVLTGQPRGPKKRGVDAVVLPVDPDIAETGGVHRLVPTAVAGALRALHRVAY